MPAIKILFLKMLMVDKCYYYISKATSHKYHILSPYILALYRFRNIYFHLILTRQLQIINNR